VTKKKTKGRGRTAVARGKPRSGSRKPEPLPDKKIQRQIYITQDLIDDVEVLREKREEQMREEYGLHCDLSWSQYAGSVLHEHRQRAKENGELGN
jgi:hypothetical protein